MSGWIALELDRAAFTAGEEVTGRFAAKFRSGSVEAVVALDYVESTPLGTVVRRRGPRAQCPAGRFAIALPADATPTLTVAHARVTWRVEVRVARFGPDDVAWQEITVR